MEEAVEEVLDLVKKAAQQIKPTEINPDFEFLIAEGEFKYFLQNKLQRKCGSYEVSE